MEALRLGRGCVGAGTNGEANACNMAFCFAVARLLATSPIPVAPGNWDRGVLQSTGTARSRETAAILSRRSFDGDNFDRAVSGRSSPHICPSASFATSV